MFFTVLFSYKLLVGFQGALQFSWFVASEKDEPHTIIIIITILHYQYPTVPVNLYAYIPYKTVFLLYLNLSCDILYFGVVVVVDWRYSWKVLAIQILNFFPKQNREKIFRGIRVKMKICVSDIGLMMVNDEKNDNEDDMMRVCV